MRVFRLDLGAVARPQRVECAFLVDALVGVRAEEVALSLHERGGEAVGTDAVVVRQRRRERRRRDTGLGCRDDDSAPGGLGAGDRLGEVRGGEQDRQVRRLGVGVGDAVEELGADDAAAAPDLADRAEVDVPAVLGGAGADLVEALRVGDDLRGVEREADVFDERVGVLDRELLLRARQVAGDRALLGSARRASGRRSPRRCPRRGRRARARSAPSTRRCPWRRPDPGSRRRAACRSRHPPGGAPRR